MAGDGGIVGGCFVNFAVDRGAHGNRAQVFSAFDDVAAAHVAQGRKKKVTITFPDRFSPKEIKCELTCCEAIYIQWE